MEAIKQAGNWGRYATFFAKIGTMPGEQILIKRDRKFKAGQIIEYHELIELWETSESMTPRWKSGVVDRVDVEGNRLFISKN